MTGKNHYDVLGVPYDATSEQIRQAYLLRSKMLHPDRFSQTSQRAEWELANEILKELNNAYGVLRDSVSRAQYDRILSGTSASKPPPQQPPPRRDPSPPPPSQPPPPPPPSVKLGRLKSGTGYFDSLPRSTQQRLRERVSGTNKIQHAISFAGLRWNYVWALILGSWLVVLFYLEPGSHLAEGVLSLPLMVTGVVALLQGANIFWIVLWIRSPLRCWYIVTPLYVIKTRLDQVWYWPIWEISNIKATHNYQNGMYQNTSLHIELGSASDDLTISPESAYNALLEALRAFDQKFRSAKAQGDWSYFLDQDDFREYDPEATAARPRHSTALAVTVFAISLAVSGLVFAIAASTTSGQTPVSDRIHQSPRTTSTSQEAPRPTPYQLNPEPKSKPFLEPELPLPPNGETYSHTQRKAVAPFEIKSSAGSSYLVKLADAITGDPVVTVFVRGGNTVNLDVPLGTFLVKYATGTKWYGYKHLFGPATGYSKANEPFTFQHTGNRVSGYTITLYKVANGNLRTEAINPDEF